MTEKNKNENPGTESGRSELDQELSDMQLDKMEFETVKKILSDYITEEIVPDDELETVTDDRALILEVTNIEEGLKKAGDLLEASLKELKYRKLETIIRDVDGQVKKLHRVEFKKKVISGKCRLDIAKDKLSVFFRYIFPETLEGNPTDYEHLRDVMKDAGITYGIDQEAINKAVSDLKKNYDVLQNIIAAKGRSPKNGEDSRILTGVFTSSEDISYSATKGKYLLEVLRSDTPEILKENYFAAIAVEKGELFVATSMPGKGEAGMDVYGNKIEAEKGNLLFHGGKNVTVKIEGDEVHYYSEIFGYPELDNEIITVNPPLWISGDFMEAYYVGLPCVSGKIKTFESKELEEQLITLLIEHGIDYREINQIIESRKAGDDSFTMRRIAKGKEARKGSNERIEFFFDTGQQPGKILESGRIDYREISVAKTVTKEQLIAVKYFAKDGEAGKNLKGEIVPAIRGDELQFAALSNVKSVLKKDKILYFATIEGRVVLVEEKGISVNAVYEIKGDVDFKTGNIDFDGVVEINGSVKPGFRIRAESNITITGMINQGAELISNGNITAGQGILGRNNDTKIKAKGMIQAQYLQNVYIEAEGNIYVTDYILNSIVKSQGKVITPQREGASGAKGAIMGGEIIAQKGIIANIIGSEYAKITKVTAGIDYEFDTKLKNYQKGIEFCDNEISKIAKILKVGLHDIHTLKERIAKLPKVKQKQFLDAFKRLNEVTQLRNEINNKREKMVKNSTLLSENAEIIIKKELFPKVLIQIGEAKFLNEKLVERVKLKKSARKNEVEFGKI